MLSISMLLATLASLSLAATHCPTHNTNFQLYTNVTGSQKFANFGRYPCNGQECDVFFSVDQPDGIYFNLTKTGALVLAGSLAPPHGYWSAYVIQYWYRTNDWVYVQFAKSSYITHQGGGVLNCTVVPDVAGGCNLQCTPPGSGIPGNQIVTFEDDLWSIGNSTDSNLIPFIPKIHYT